MELVLFFCKIKEPFLPTLLCSLEDWVALGMADSKVQREASPIHQTSHRAICSVCCPTENGSIPGLLHLPCLNPWFFRNDNFPKGLTHIRSICLLTPTFLSTHDVVITTDHQGFGVKSPKRCRNGLGTKVKSKEPHLSYIMFSLSTTKGLRTAKGFPKLCTKAPFFCYYAHIL